MAPLSQGRGSAGLPTEERCICQPHLDCWAPGASCAGWWQKGVATKQPLAELMGLINSHVATHFVFSKTVWPLLKKDAVRGGGGGSRVAL